MIENKKVQILMSTYNGETFLREQIESLLKQTYLKIEILIRDDGSEDRTVDILKEYAASNKNIHIYLENNIGVTKSFFELLKRAEADYIAFCDQDDVWQENKVEEAVKKLKDKEEPWLYFSNRTLVDESLNVLPGQRKRKCHIGFGNALVESICTGCTIVMNRKLTDIIKMNIPDNAIIHDWWCYLVAAYKGNITYDENSYIWYRQHEKNVVGANTSWIKTVKSKMYYLKKNSGRLKAQLEEFARIYQGIKEKDELLERLCRGDKFPERFFLVFNTKLYRQSKLDEMAMRILLFTNRML